MKSLVLNMFLLCILMSCTKDNETQVPGKMANNQTKVTTRETSIGITTFQPAVSHTLPVSNPDNPFDGFGHQHNLVVSYLMACTHPRIIGHDTAVTNCLQEYARANGLADWHLPVAIKAQEILSDSVNEYRNVIGKVGFREPVKRRMMDLLLLVKMKLSTPDANMLDALKAVKHFETGIMADEGLLSFEKRRLLEGAAVARYSMDYWDRWLSRSEFKPQAKLFGWFAAVSSDISAALVTGHFGVAAEVSETFYWLELYVG